jgi:hypothetical protein
MAGPMQSMEKMMPKVDEVTFWAVINVVLFLYVGILQLVYRYGPGTILSAGAVVLAVLYLLLWTWGKTNRKMAHQWMMVISGLAVLGDLVAIAVISYGFFSGTSALLDFAGIMLFRSTYKEFRGPA